MTHGRLSVPMHRRLRAPRGLAEIVGTLMLVLIVVAAATAFSFFVASYQQQLQAQENDNHLRSLESVHMLSVLTAPVSGTDPTFSTLTFTFASGDVNALQLSDLVINGNPVVSYHAVWLQNGTGVDIGIVANDTATYLNVPSLAQVQISLQLNATLPLFSFLSASEIPTASSYLTFNLQTQRASSFTFVYVPPTALADVLYIESYSGGIPVEIPVLDGTRSFQAGANATIVDWSWSINDTSNASAPCYHTSCPASGAEFELSDSHEFPAGDSYTAVLTVTNSLGLYALSVPLPFIG